MQRISSIYAGTQNMQLDISRKKLDIDGHLVSILGGCGSLERTDFNSFYSGMEWLSRKN